MNNLNKRVLYLSGLVLKNFLSNESWKLFGFKSRPRRGEIFRRFVNKTKLAKEDFFVKELILLSIIDVILAIKKQGIEEDNKSLYIIGVLSELFSPLSKSKIFNSDEDYLEFIKNGYEDYLNRKFIVSFISRVKKSIDEKNSISLVAGAVFLATHSNLGKGSILDNNIFLDRAVLAQEILPIDNTEKLSFPLDKSKFKFYYNFASELISK